MQIDLWIVDLETLDPSKFRSLLSDEELARADRFHFERDRRHFTAARGFLRNRLGAAVGSDPAGLVFSYGPKGKPSLPTTSIRFNVSHSHGLAAFAITQNHEIGVDVERFNRKPLEEGVAERFFSTQEVAALRSLPVNLQPQAFFNCWTRKEAYIKAIGEGLSIGLDQFDVSLIPGDAARLLQVRENPAEVQRWAMHDLRVPADFAGALCVEDHDAILTYH